MDPQYNLEIKVEPRQEYIPQREYDETVRLLDAQGLVGEVHVDPKGKLGRGYGSKVEVFREGVFHIHYREDLEETARDILEHAKLTTSGFDEVEQETLDLGETIVDMLERCDPSSQVLSWRDYNSFPICPNMELVTACGRQSVHVHTTTGGIIQFWKPNKEEQWYDWDLVRNALFDAFINEWSVADELRSIPKYQILKRRAFQRKYREISRLAKLYRELSLNPACVDQVDF